MTGRVVVVGAGVAGLTTAYRLLLAEPSLTVSVFETDARIGGVIHAVRVGDLELDAGPEAFMARKPWATELGRELGLELVPPRAHGSYVWTDRGLLPLPPTALGVPAELDALARWPGLSRAGRLRALSDLVRRAEPSFGDEALGALARRRLGDACTDALVQPLLGGLFAGDVDRLSVLATYPELAGWERDFGSLIRGARAAAKLGREAGPMFLRPRHGMASLPGALASAVGEARVRTGAVVAGIAAAGTGFVVRVGGEELGADAVVLATPAAEAARLLEPIAPAAATELGALPSASVGVVLLVYPPGTAEALPEASGFVVPRGKAPMLSASLVSSTWPDDAFGERAVVRCVVGGAGSEDVLEAPDGDIVGAVERHLAAVLPLPPAAEASAVVRWSRAMPQYEVGHLERVEAALASLPPGIFVVGNAYEGVGVADVVRGANRIAERVRAHLAGGDRSGEREH